MRPGYWLRIATGVVLGLAALVTLWLFVGLTWLTATVAALIAPLGFLGSYFVVTADRPEEGFEQVLFDRPNTLVSMGMVALFALAGVGTGFLGGEPAPGPADGLYALRAEYQTIADAYANEESDGPTTIDALNALRERLDPVTRDLEALPDGDAKTALIEASDALAQAMVQLKTCAGGESAKCVDARISMADAQAALERYQQLAA